MRTRYIKQLNQEGSTLSWPDLDAALTMRFILPESDHSLLAEAFTDAYLDTSDYEGCTPRQIRADAEVEIELTLAGQFGRWLPEASLAVTQENGLVVAAVLLVEWHGGSWLRGLFVRRGFRRLGLATELLSLASDCLNRDGYKHLSTFTNEHNRPAVSFLAAHGFSASSANIGRKETLWN